MTSGAGGRGVHPLHSLSLFITLIDSIITIRHHFHIIITCYYLLVTVNVPYLGAW